MATDRIETTKPETTMNAPLRSGLKTFALGAGAAAAGAVAAQAVTAGVRGIVHWAKGDKKEQAKAAFGGGSGLLKLK